MVKEIMREMELEIQKKEQAELWIEKAWAAYAKKIEKQRMKFIS